MEAQARTTFEALGPDRTVLTLVTDFPGLDESKVAFVTGLMQRSGPTDAERAQARAVLLAALSGADG
jgi:hypothetical protein